MKNFLLLLCFFVASQTFASDSKMPDNAHQSDFSSKGWSCDRNYIEQNGWCRHISTASDNQIKIFMINESLASYPGNCPCPYFTDKAGRKCGKRSAYSRPGGYSPLCYKLDISPQMITDFRNKYK